MSPLDIWGVLGIEKTHDVVAIRRAYAAVLKRTHPDDNPTGFAELRQAYEQALRLARVAETMAQKVVAAPPEAAPPEAASPEAASPEAAPTPPSESLRATLAAEVDHLRQAFLALKQAATASPPAGPQTLLALLEACLDAPALETLSVQLEFEPVMVQFLIQTLPVSQCLLDTVIDRWKWRERLRSRAGPGITLLLMHAENLLAVEQLNRTSPRAYRALTSPPRPLLLWLGIVFFSLHRAVREALGNFRSVSPGIFNPQALQWWSDFQTRPRPRPEWIRTTLVLMAGTGLVGGFASGDGGALHRVLTGIFYGGLIGLVLTCFWWGLVDWPRYKLRSLRQKAPLRLRLGWAPACFAACIFAALLPDNSWGITVALMVSYALLQWALTLAPPFAAFGQKPLMRVWGLAVVNLPVSTWWLSFLAAPAGLPAMELPTIPMTVVFVATLITFALGQPLLWTDFLRDMTVEARQSVRWGMLGLALSGLAVALLTTPGGLAGRVILMCLVVIVLAHRTVAGNLSGPQIRVNAYVCYLAAYFVLRSLFGERIAPGLRLGGAVFMLGVIYNTVLSFYNEWRASREATPTAA